MEGVQPAGRQSREWNGRDGAGRDAASGVYLARLRAGGERRVRPLVLVR
jgi:hypothetical protein